MYLSSFFHTLSQNLPSHVSYQFVLVSFRALHSLSVLRRQTLEITWPLLGQWSPSRLQAPVPPAGLHPHTLLLLHS